MLHVVIVEGKECLVKGSYVKGKERRREREREIEKVFSIVSNEGSILIAFVANLIGI